MNQEVGAPIVQAKLDAVSQAVIATNLYAGDRPTNRRAFTIMVQRTFRA